MTAALNVPLAGLGVPANREARTVTTLVADTHAINKVSAVTDAAGTARNTGSPTIAPVTVIVRSWLTTAVRSKSRAAALASTMLIPGPLPMLILPLDDVVLDTFEVPSRARVSAVLLL